MKAQYVVALTAAVLHIFFFELATVVHAQEATGPLRVSADNPRYFEDAYGDPVLLTGSHVWYNLADMGTTDPPVPFDFNAYLQFLRDRNHNFIRLWSWELVTVDGTHFVTPHPYGRTGPGTGLDGKPKFNLRYFDPDYFNRLRTRIQAAGQQGIYVAVMLFEGYGIQFKTNAWQQHPFNPANNINSVTEVLAGQPNGLALHTLQYPAVTALQEDYVAKVIDTVNDLDNVLYEIANESHPGSTAWQYHMIDFIRAYEQGKPKQHPIGMTFQYDGGNNQALFDSSADWISPNQDDGYRDDPPAGDGSKVIIVDTDHLWGIGGDQAWVWKSFMRGLNFIFMDPYDGVLFGQPFDAQWDPVRKSMGYALTLAQHVDLTHMTPNGALASTNYCLADPGEEYFVYLPWGNSVNVNLSAVVGAVTVDWFNPNTGETATTVAVPGGATRAFASPFGWNDVVLHLRREDAPNQPPILNPIGNKQVVASQPLQFTVSAWESDTGDTLTYGTANLPAGATFDAGTRTFSWTTGSGDVGVHENVAFSVTDDGAPPLSDSETITITVLEPSGENDPPVFDPIGDKHVEPGEHLDFTVNATDPGDWLSYTVENLPASANWWPGARRVTWSATEADIGVHADIVFTATDHGVPPLSVSETIKITVGRHPADVNADGTIDAMDLQAVINALLGHGSGLDCDVNDDNVVDALDVQIVTNAVLGVG